MLKNYLFCRVLLISALLTISLTSFASNKLVQYIKIPAPSLAGSVMKNNDLQRIQVRLPASYFESEKKYPVVFYFHGYGGSVSESKKMVNSEYKELSANGELQEIIVVGVSGKNSFYVNSPISGNWEDYVVKDVLSYVDSNFRTIKAPKYRGLAGFSMGGFAAINIGFNHPDKFKHVFSLSPGLFNESGLIQAHEQWLSNGWDKFLIDYAKAFAPNQNANDDKLWFEYDPKNLSVVKMWESGFGNIKIKVANYEKNPQKLDSFKIEYGSLDQFNWIVTGSLYLVQELKDKELEVQSFDNEGGHTINDTIGLRIMHFFSEAFLEE